MPVSTHGPCTAVFLLLHHNLLFSQQVHKARLHDGRLVAVKVQYLGLEAAVAADMTTLSALSMAAAWLFPASFKLGWVLEDLRRNLDLELDFQLEAENASKLARLFKGRRDVIAPAAIPQVSLMHCMVSQLCLFHQCSSPQLKAFAFETPVFKTSSLKSFLFHRECSMHEPCLS